MLQPGESYLISHSSDDSEEENYSAINYKPDFAKQEIQDLLDDLTNARVGSDPIEVFDFLVEMNVLMKNSCDLSNWNSPRSKLTSKEEIISKRVGAAFRKAIPAKYMKGIKTEYAYELNRAVWRNLKPVLIKSVTDESLYEFPIRSRTQSMEVYLGDVKEWVALSYPNGLPDTSYNGTQSIIARLIWIAHVDEYWPKMDAAVNQFYGIVETSLSLDDVYNFFMDSFTLKSPISTAFMYIPLDYTKLADISEMRGVINISPLTVKKIDPKNGWIFNHKEKSSFTGDISALQHGKPVSGVTVETADGQSIYPTHRGYMSVTFPSVSGKDSLTVTTRTYYVPNLKSNTFGGKSLENVISTYSCTDTGIEFFKKSPSSEPYVISDKWQHGIFVMDPSYFNRQPLAEDGRHLPVTA